MFNNQFGTPGFYGNNFVTAQQYNAVRKPRFTNPLTEEDKKMLKSEGGFSLFVSDKDMKKAMCTHKDGDQISLRENPDGTHTCWVCNETFNVTEMSPESVREATRQFCDILQSIKTFYLDIPEGVVREFFQMLPFIAKTPEIYDMALNNFNSYNAPLNTPYMNGNQTFGMYDALTNPGFMYNAPAYNTFQQPPQYNQPFGGNMYQQPMYNTQMPIQQAGIPNGAQMAGGFGYMDNGMPVGAAPAQVVQQQPGNVPPAPFSQPNKNTPQETIEQTKTFSV